MPLEEGASACDGSVADVRLEGLRAAAGCAAALGAAFVEFVRLPLLFLGAGAAVLTESAAPRERLLPLLGALGSAERFRPRLAARTSLASGAGLGLAAEDARTASLSAADGPFCTAGMNAEVLPPTVSKWIRPSGDDIEPLVWFAHRW